MRGKTPNQQIIMAWNPISKDSWLYEFSVEKPPENSVFIHSTYKDNPFLEKSYVEALEELYKRNPQKARIYCDGEWGIESDGLVFQNWEEKEFDEMALASAGLELRVGSDLGFVDATTIVCSLYDKQNATIYIYDEFYKSGC
ncbi:MAG: phage terminase large subunit [Firmicutes bacterium]|nr:phage terminase large subunit [Candidatus Caballimonas caccae]